MNDPTTDGWVTFQKVQLPDGRIIVVQKNDGATRTFILPRRGAASSTPGGEMVTSDDFHPASESAWWDQQKGPWRR